MKEYSVEAIIWEDHTKVDRGFLPKNPDSVVETTLSIGLVAQETKKVIVLASDVERYAERDECTYLVLFKTAIISRKNYGTIKINKIRR